MAQEIPYQDGLPPYAEAFMGSGTTNYNIGVKNALAQSPISLTTGEFWKQNKDSLSKGWIPEGYSSSTPMQGTMLEPAMNANQKGTRGSNAILDAHKSIMDLYKDWSGGTGGLPIPGESDVRIRRSASGIPFTTISTSAREGAEGFQGSKSLPLMESYGSGITAQQKKDLGLLGA